MPSSQRCQVIMTKTPYQIHWIPMTMEISFSMLSMVAIPLLSVSNLLPPPTVMEMGVEIQMRIWMMMEMGFSTKMMLVREA